MDLTDNQGEQSAAGQSPELTLPSLSPRNLGKQRQLSQPETLEEGQDSQRLEAVPHHLDCPYHEGSPACASPLQSPIAIARWRNSTTGPHHQRRPSQATSCHTAAQSSLGSPGDFDFFSTSFASTAPTSTYSQSPNSPRSGFDAGKSLLNSPVVPTSSVLQESRERRSSTGAVWCSELSSKAAPGAEMYALPPLQESPRPNGGCTDSAMASNGQTMSSSGDRRWTTLEPTSHYAAFSRGLDTINTPRRPDLANTIPNQEGRPLASFPPSHPGSVPFPTLTPWSVHEYYTGAVMGPRARPGSTASAPTRRQGVDTHGRTGYMSRARRLLKFPNIRKKRNSASRNTDHGALAAAHLHSSQSQAVRSEGGTPHTSVPPLVAFDANQIWDALVDFQIRGEQPDASGRINTSNTQTLEQLSESLVGEGLVASSTLGGPSAAAFTHLPVCSDVTTSAIPPCLLRRPLLLRNALTAPGVSTALGTASHAAIARDSFNMKLPREIGLRILSTLCHIHIENHQNEILSGSFRGSAARTLEPRGHWLAMRELIRLSRVSKAFMRLALDGQLWRKLNFPGIPDLRVDGMRRLFDSASTFVEELDLSHLPNLDNHTLRKLFGSLIARGASGKSKVRRIDLRSTARVSKSTLLWMLQSSPDLRVLSLRDVTCVDNDVLQTIGEQCPMVEDLDVSRCREATSSGIFAWLKARASHAKTGSVHTLRAAGLTWENAEHARILSETLPELSTLDVSASRSFVDAHLEAMTRHLGPGTDPERAYVQINARQANSTSYEEDHYRAIIPSLSHLNLSRTGITERGCSYLAYGALPSLEILELAHCPMSRDKGLVALLESSPRLRRLDLDGVGRGASERALQAITPPKETNTTYPGHELTHLILCRAKGAEATALLALVEACPKLHHLEVDCTGADDRVAQRFVEVIRDRRRATMSSSQQSATSTPASREPVAPVASHPAVYSLAYVSLVDCQAATRAGFNSLVAMGGLRSRRGQRGSAYNSLLYSDPESSFETPRCGEESLTTQQQIHRLLSDECNGDRICIKGYWLWQLFDKHERERKKREAKRLKKANQRRALMSVVSPGLTQEGNSRAMSRNGSGSGADNAAGQGPRIQENGPMSWPVLDLGDRDQSRPIGIRSRISQWSFGLPIANDSDDDDDDTRAACHVM